VDRRLLLCGLAAGAVAVALAISFWHEGIERSDTVSSTRAVAQPPRTMAVSTGTAAPAAAAMNPLPAIAPSPEPEQAAAQSEPIDNGERNRGTERSGRAR
jgi:hypothetical protein